MTDQIPLVDYLVLGEQPHLVANECTSCGARFFDRRNGCASCGGSTFTTAAVDTEGEVKAFTIVSFAAPGVPVPFVAAFVDCGGTSVRANLVNVEPDDAHVRLGMKVRLTAAARADLEEIGDWIARDDPIRALSSTRELQGRCLSLTRLPARFPIVLEVKGGGLRTLSHHGYAIFYLVTADGVDVLRIVHGARDWAALFGDPV